MKVKGEIFRMYDIRGIAYKDMLPDFAELLGKVIGTMIIERGGKRISVGMDVRLSSEDFKDAAVAGLRSVGVEVLDLEMIPTPLMYFSLYKFPVNGGLQITASHNPKEFNGFKMVLGKETLYGEAIQVIREKMEKEEYRKGFSKGKIEKTDAISPYIERMKEEFKFSSPPSLALDTGNGTAGPLLSMLFDTLSVPFKGLYLDPDGRFPHHLPDPTVLEYVRDLMKTVVDEKFSLGIGIDGDGDRMGAIDEKGQMVFPDRLVGIFAGEILRGYPGEPIIFDVKCSQGLIDFIKARGGKPVMWKTGHSLLKAKLHELNAPFAGEMSGHLFFNDRYYGYDDALYSTLRLLELLEKSGRSLSDLVSDIPFYHATPEIRVSCPDEKKFDVVAQLVGFFKEKGYQVIDIDGARVQFEDGFGLVRASNTQAVLVLRFEAKSEDRLKEIMGIFKEALDKFPEVETEGKI